MLEEKTIPNFICMPVYGPKTFEVRSEFYEYAFELPNSNQINIITATSKAMKAIDECKNLTLEQRAKILKESAARLHFNQEETEHFIRMTGMPLRYVKERLRFTKKLLKEIPEVVRRRIGNYHDTLARKIRKGSYEIRTSPSGMISAFIPPNDPAEAAFVFAHTVMSGGTIVLKPSQQEPYMAIKLAELISKAGYPEGGLNVVHWDTQDPKNSNLATKLIERSKKRIIMGDITTAKALLSDVEDPLGSYKNCILSAGKSKSIIYEPKDLDRAVSEITSSSLDWTTDCVSTKVVIIVGDKEKTYNTFLRHFEIKSRRIGNPLNPKTEIGYIQKELADDLEEKIKTAEEFGRIKLLNGPFERKSPDQIKPVLLEAFAPDIDFVTSELPYVLTLVYVNSFEEAIDFVNETSALTDEKRSMALSLYSGSNIFNNKKHQTLFLDAKAYMKHINHPTMALNPYLRHQNIAMTEFLTEVQSLNI